jgi:glycosyltransferase involved in cell wall biosynthesis
VLEAMMVGVPVVGLATTEMVTVIHNEQNGILHTDVDYLIEKMNELIANKTLAEKLGAEGKRTAIRRFNIERFANDWEDLVDRVTRGGEIKKELEIAGGILQ